MRYLLVMLLFASWAWGGSAGGAFALLFGAFCFTIMGAQGAQR